MRISDWSSDVCSSDLCSARPARVDQQELHLVGKNSPVRQNQVLGEIRDIWHRQQATIRLFRRAVVFALIATSARRNHVFPYRRPNPSTPHHKRRAARRDKVGRYVTSTGGRRY